MLPSPVTSPILGNPSGEDKFNVLGIFPSGFTLICITILLGPVIKGATVAFDPDVEFWLGELPKLLVAPPLLVLIAHFIHWWAKGPSKFAVVLALCGSGGMLMLCGNEILVKALALGGGFQSTDCSYSVPKYTLERSWQAAQKFRASCGKSAVRIQDCDGYAEMLKKNPSWEYLQSLEQRYSCGGWCEAEKPLWAVREAEDSCSKAVAYLMSNRVRRTAFQEALFGLGLVVISSTVLIWVGPALREKGVNW
mmetsp:Transcript_907/g.2268  ORF Transcript_907/g.2268 Transcript_907/m.2268 type:complete len:251 (+) Transcript_907:29-781(+)|eukprot:CAMPEP_0170595862 /NCGR_PEP_ID=MMETSP0224-20130122/14793_1 /TAXON_ID=285029 /ORGANISM="Togula jolla, Strain CCCM 725" /LENGTH=250 /DNA_ID=CAMNT_0010920081 /DNA_START=29 /DNA_END=781 /DNA_ORIENTATION=-